MAFGANDFGKLGVGDTEDKKLPTLVEFYEEVSPVAVVSGAEHSILLDDQGALWSSGKYSAEVSSNKFIRIPNIPSNFCRIASGENHWLALNDIDEVWAYSPSARHYLLGNGETYKAVGPARVSGLPGVRLMNCGSNYSIIQSLDGELWGWGSGSDYQLGPPKRSIVYTPERISIEGLAEGDLRAIGTGALHTTILDCDGTLFSCGYNFHGQIGRTGEITSFLPVTGIPPFVTVVSGGFHMLGLDEEGYVWSWGWAEFGKIGRSTTAGSDDNRLPVRLDALGPRNKEIANGMMHSMVINDEDELIVFGNDSKGELGYPKNSSSHKPVVHPTLKPRKFISLGPKSARK